MNNMENPVVKVEHLSHRYSVQWAIRDINFEIYEKGILGLLGSNGAGKSTLSYVLSGKPGYEVTGGSVRFKGKNLLAMPAEERAREGVFLIMQYPVEIPGVPTSTFLKHAVNAVRASDGGCKSDERCSGESAHQRRGADVSSAVHGHPRNAADTR